MAKSSALTGSPLPLDSKQAKLWNTYATYLPQIMNITNAQETPAALAQLGATQATLPGYNALNLQQLLQYGLPAAQAGQQIQSSNALAGSQTLLDQLQGPGGQAAIYGTALNNALNPAQAAANGQAANLVNSINLNGLSGGEQAAVERSLNQSNYATGNLGLDNATNAVSNAMQFGNALQAKRAALGSALGTATGVASSQNQQINPFAAAIGQPSPATQSNFGTNTFSPTSPNSLGSNTSNTFGFGSGLLGNQTSLQNTSTSAGAQLGVANAMPAYIGSICCFIMLEAYHGTMPTHVRKSRDKYYKYSTDMAAGYRRVAYYIVPLMKKSSAVRSIVWHLMVHPITKHLGFVHGIEDYSWLNKKICRFWLRTWTILGRNKNESAYNKEFTYAS